MMSSCYRRKGIAFISRTCIRSVKTFQEIPGPKPWPVFGNSLLFSPLGPYQVSKLLDGFADLQKKYGNIIKLKMGKQHSVLVFNPDDIRLMFMNEGKYPKRPTFEALKQYRKEKYQIVGVVPDNGEEWHKMRQHVQILLRLKTVHSYWLKQKAIAEEFPSYLLSKQNADGIVKNFLEEAFLYSLEAIAIVCYGKRIYCLSNNSEECEEIVKNNIDFLKALGETFHQPPWWKLWKTQAYQVIETTQDFMMKIAIKYLEEARLQLIENSYQFAEENPILFYILDNKNLTEDEKNLLVTEIFQGGIDATATVITMMLYELSRNQQIQNEIYENLKEQNMLPGHYPQLLRACLKETLRLHPTAGGTSRILDSDTMLSGFFVPKGTLVIGVNPTISRMGCYFSNPLQFKPLRWLDKTNMIHPYGSLPFGHGARMCPGRRFAEQEILLGVAEVLKKFIVLPVDSKDVSMVLTMNLVPSEPIDFKLIAR